jgi:hypothetical protein
MEYFKDRTYLCGRVWHGIIINWCDSKKLYFSDTYHVSAQHDIMYHQKITYWFHQQKLVTLSIITIKKSQIPTSHKPSHCRFLFQFPKIIIDKNTINIVPSINFYGFGRENRQRSPKCELSKNKKIVSDVISSTFLGILFI